MCNWYTYITNGYIHITNILIFCFYQIFLKNLPLSIFPWLSSPRNTAVADYANNFLYVESSFNCVAACFHNALAQRCEIFQIITGYLSYEAQKNEIFDPFVQKLRAFLRHQYIFTEVENAKHSYWKTDLLKNNLHMFIKCMIS